MRMSDFLSRLVRPAAWGFGILFSLLVILWADYWVQVRLPIVMRSPDDWVLIVALWVMILPIAGLPLFFWGDSWKSTDCRKIALIALRLTYCYLVAFPLTGALLASYWIALSLFSGISLVGMFVDLVYLFWGTAYVPDHLGILPPSNGRPEMDLHPWIVLVAVILFLVFSRAWRWNFRLNWLERDRAE